MIEPALFASTPAPEEDVTTTLYRAAIGPVGGNYYLPIFTRFEAADHAGISWNTAASLLTLNWLVFRKLWVAALAYAGIVVTVALLVFGIGRVVFQFSDTLMMALGLGFGLAAFVLPGLFGNALFHTACRKAMSKALVGHANVADAREALLREASTRRRAIWLAAANVAVLLIAVLVYLQIAAFSSVSVLPHGALDTGQVAVGRAVVSTPAASAATAPVPMAVASATQTAASAASTAVSAPSSAVSAPASAPTPLAMASTPTATASAAAPAASEPKPARAVAPASSPVVAAPVQTPASAPLATPSAATATRERTAPPIAKAIAAPASRPAAAKPGASKPATSASKAPAASKPTVEKPAASAAVAVKPKKETDKAKQLQAAVTPPKATPPTPEAADTTARPFFINVGLFSVPENAERAHAKLLEAKLPSVMKELKAKTRQIRVRVGPFASQVAADAAVEKIKTLQLDAVIIQP